MAATSAADNVDWLAPELRQRLVNLIIEIDATIKNIPIKEIEKGLFSKKLQKDFQDLLDPTWNTNQIGRRFTGGLLSKEDNEEAIFYQTFYDNGFYRGVKLGKKALEWLKMEEENIKRIENPEPNLPVVHQSIEILKGRIRAGSTASEHLLLIPKLKKLEADVIDLQKLLSESNAEIKEITEKVTHTEDELKDIISVGEEANKALKYIKNESTL